MNGIAENSIMNWPLLTMLQLLPLVGAAIIPWLNSSKIAALMATVFATAELLLAIVLYMAFDLGNSGFQFVEQWPLLSRFGYVLAIDGVSMLFILLTALLMLLTVIYTRARGTDDLIRLFSLLLLVESLLIVQFMTLNLAWFAFFTGIELVVMGYLLSHWSTSPERDLARSSFAQFMAISMVLFVSGAAILGWNYADQSGGDWSFNLLHLQQYHVPSNLQSIVFFLLFYGLSIRIPLFPMHGWLPTVAAHGSVAIAPAILLGLKVGIYGLIRFVLPLVPEAVDRWAPYIVGIAVAGVFYAAILAFMQRNMRRLLAFAVISHTCIVIIGLFALGHNAFPGAVMLSVNFGLASAGLLFMSGFVFRRTGSMLLSRLGGLFDVIPLIGVTFFIAGLSIVGMPGTPGFDAVHLVLEAAMARFGAPVTIAAALGNVAAAGFLLWAFQRAFLTPKKQTSETLEPANGMEKLVAVMMLLVLLVAGFYSQPWLDLIEPSLRGLDALYATQHH